MTAFVEKMEERMACDVQWMINEAWYYIIYFFRSAHARQMIQNILLIDLFYYLLGDERALFF